MYRKIVLLLVLFHATMTNAQWSQVGNDIDDVTNAMELGKKVVFSADGTTLATIGLYKPGFDFANKYFPGVLQVYEFANDVWVQKGTNIISSQNIKDNGFSDVKLSADGNVVAVGNAEINPDRGYVRVYEFINNDWQQIGSDLEGEGNGDGFGDDIGLSSDGTVLAVGADGNDIGTGSFGSLSSAGHVRVFKNNNGTWLQMGSDIDGTLRSARFGDSLVLSEDGTYVAIASNQEDDQLGNVKVYEFSDNDWNQVGQTIEANNLDESFSDIGLDLTANKNTLVIGSWDWVSDNFEEQYQRGIVYIYEKDINNQWILVDDIKGKIDDSSRYGEELTIASDGNSLGVLAPDYDTDVSGEGRGRGYYYEKKQGSWSLEQTFTASFGNDDIDTFSMSKNGEVIGLGSQFVDFNSNNNVGQIKVFSSSSNLSLSGQNIVGLNLFVEQRKIQTTIENVKLTIYSSLGQKLKNEDLQTGIYLVRVTKDNLEDQFKIIIH